MSASSSSPRARTARRVVAAVLLSALSAAAVAGCTIPGKERLEGTPKGMPASLAYLPGDSLGWLIVDPSTARDESMDLMRALGMSEASFSVPVLSRVVPGSGGADWVGRAAGVARYTARSGEASRLTFADVAKRTELEHALEEASWKRTSTKLDAGTDDDLTLWTRAGATGGELGAIGVNDEALVGAKNRMELAALLKHTRRYAASERPGTVDYTIDALKASPVAVVFRSDQVRADLRTLVSDSPALTEMTRWLTQASAIYALRDGWIGIVPAGGDLAATDVRVVGRMDWARAATDVPEPKPVLPLEPAALAHVDWAVRVSNPGAYVRDIVDAVSDGGNEFVTEEDAPKGTPRLGDTLDELNGEALIVGLNKTVTMTADADQAQDVARDVERGIELTGLEKWLSVRAMGDQQVMLQYPGNVTDVTRARVSEPDAQDPVQQMRVAIAGAGKAPNKPVAWVYLAKSPCDAKRPAAGWMSWHSPSQRLSWSFDVPVGAKSDCTRLLEG